MASNHPPGMLPSDNPGKKALAERIARLTPEQRELYERRRQRTRETEKPRIPLRKGKGPWPASTDQTALWFIQQLDPASSAYNIGNGCRVRGKLDIPLLESALNMVLRRHEILRTSFKSIEGKPYQIVSDLQLKIPVIDVSTAADPEKEARAAVAQWIKAPFDLEQPPLLRLPVVRVTEEDYVLIGVLHHIITDWWSYHLFFGELFGIYTAYAENRPCPFPELPIQYGDWAAWRDEWEKSEDFQKQEAYWMRRLDEVPHVLELPADRPRPAVQSHQGAREFFVVSPENVARLRDMNRQAGTSSYMTFLGVLHVFLVLYTGQEDFLVGTPVSADRDSKDTAALIGYMLNTVVLRADLSGHPNFLQVLERVRQTCLEAFAHKEFPFRRLVERLRPERDLSRMPLYQVEYVYTTAESPVPRAEGTAGWNRQLPGFEVSSFGAERQTSPVDLQIAFTEGQDRLGLMIEYNTDIFESATVRCMGEQIVDLMEMMLTEPERCISDLPLQRLEKVSFLQRHSLLESFNSSAREVQERTLPELYEAQVARTPDSAAVIFDDTLLSYGELNQRTDQMARHLRGLGVGPECFVGVFLERSPEMLITLLGVLKAGGAYLPIDPEYPAARLEQILTDASPMIVVTTSGLSDRLKTSIPLLYLDSAETKSALDPAPVRNRVPQDAGPMLLPHHPAYVIYTSGSTGKPKGVVIQHRSTATFVAWAGSVFSSEEWSGVLASTAITFDLSVFEIFATWSWGGTVILAKSVLDLPVLPARDRVRLINTVPSAARSLIDSDGLPSSVRTINLAGEALPNSLVQRLYGISQVDRVFNLYGPSEATTYSTFAQCLRDVHSEPSIGGPIWNTRAYVLNASLEPLPIGVTGLLYVAGDGLARGYLKHPELTAERFVVDPFGAPGARMYLTGDLARWTAKGELEFAGRIDQQVKVRGYRIELGEIETALAAHSKVSQAAAVVREDQPHGKRIVAYVAPATKEGLDAEELRQHMAQTLPVYMMPATIVVLDALPLLSNGKLDRKALPAPVWTADTYRAPRTRVEQVLCQIVAEVLSLQRVGLSDNFFTLGGDSILAIQVISRARKEGFRLTPQDIFRYKTIEGLAAMASALESAGEASTGNTEGIGELIPTPIMRFFFARGGATQRWSHSTLLKVPEDLRQKDLISALQALIDTHDVLRLRQDTDLNLFIPSPGSVKAEDCVFCLETFTSDDARSAARMAQDRLDPKRGIMLQAIWFTGAQRLLLVIHHLAVDGVSWRILIPDLRTAWHAVKRNQQPQLDPVSTPFRVWAARLAELATTRAVEAELPFWESTLSRGTPLAPGLMLDKMLDTIGSANHLQITLPDSMARALLTTVPAAFYARVDEVLLAGLVLALAAWWRDNSVHGDWTALIDMEEHGRDLPGESLDTSRTVGWFTALHPVALSLTGLDIDEALEGGAAAGQAIKRIKDQLRAVPGKGLSYGLLRYLNAQAGPRLAGMSLPQIGFNYLGKFSQGKGEDWSLAPEAAALSGMADAQMPMVHLLEIDVRAMDAAQGQRLHASLTWTPRHITELQVRSLARLWQRSLQAMVRHAGGSSSRWHSPSDFPLVQLTAEQVEHLETVYSGIEDVLPLTPLQEGLLFHALYNPGVRDVYTIQIGMNIEGALDSSRMQRAVEALLQRHPSLRAVFFHEGLSHAVQIILARVQVLWREMDWSSMTDEEKDEHRRHVKLEERAQHFVFSISPLFRFVVIRLERERYLLLFTVHHILMDGWSAPLFLRELFVLYGSNADAGLLQPVTPYASYLHWLASHDRVAALAAWQEYLAGLDGGTHVVRSREEIHAPEPQPFCERMLSPELTSDLQRLAREHGLTLNTIIQGLWAVLLAKVTSRNDVVFGITVSGRPADLPGIEGTIGLFINTVPVRVRLNPAEKLSVLLAGIQESQGGLIGIQHVGLAEIQRVAGLGELFDTLLVFENYPKDSNLTKTDFGGIHVSKLESQDSTHYALALVLHTGEKLRFKLQFNPTRIDNATVERTADEFMRLLEASMTSADKPWQHLILPGEHERRQILYEWNRPQKELSGPACVHGLFEEQVQRTPEAIAAVFGEAALTYAELNLRANRLAHYLQQLGVKTENRVAICLERGMEIIVAELGILKAGGVYVPLDPGYPAQHKAMLLSDSGARVIVTKKDMGKVEISGMTRVDIEDALSEKMEGEEKSPTTMENGEALAYILYTSGSTGQPKGVMAPHRAIKRLVINSGYAEWSGERVAFGSNPAFDAATMEIWGPLLNGGRVVVIDQETLLDPRKLGAEIKRQRLSVMWMTVGLFNQYVAELKEELAGLRYLIVGGDALDARTMKGMVEDKVPEHLFNGYGPTETTTFALLHEIKEVGEKERNIPIGRPIGNTWVYLVNGEMDPVPVGAIGEICIGGEGVGRGYVNRGDLTAEQFVPNPYIEEKNAGDRMYRTGDLGRWRPDGTVEFLGRNGHQIKLHGFRIELGEIEARLSECEGVGEAVVLAWKDTTGMKRLVAYYTPEGAAQGESGPGQAGVLRSRLEEKLPRYMVPAAYVRLEKFPLTTNGKVDRKKLPAPEAEAFAVCGYEEPIGEMEKTLARIWADVLQVERVGRHDNFFALGGHSLLAMRLVNSIRSLLGVNLAIQTVFEIQSMAALARTVEEMILKEIMQMQETAAVQIASRLSGQQ